MKIIIIIIVNALHTYMVSAKSPKLKLNSGYEMPVLGLGTWQTKGSALVNAVMDAIEVGYRLIDTAQYYQNEKDVGKAIHQSIENGFVNREDIFITTKVWPTIDTREEAFDMIKHSIRKLNSTYLDLVLIHYPNNNYYEIYKGLEMAYNQNMVRSLGVSNFGINELEAVLKMAYVKPSINQIRIDPTINQEVVVQFCKDNDIAVTGYSPLGMGQLINDNTLKSMAQKYGKTSAQIMIRWQIERGLIVIPKSIRKNRIIENFDVFNFQLSNNDMNVINSMKQKSNDFEFWKRPFFDLLSGLTYRLFNRWNGFKQFVNDLFDIEFFD